MRRLLAGVLAVVTGGAGTAVLLQPQAAAARPAHGAVRSLSGAVRSAGSPYAAPIVIAHRGASALRPEHTLLAYRTAIAHGAEYLEVDLVATRDGVLVARHENELSKTTDVEHRPEFAHRKTTKIIDGVAVTGWFTEDFTLRELRTLRAEERFPRLRPHSAAYNGLEPVPTFEEVVRLARYYGVGLYPETKHPGYFAAIGLPLEERMLQVLARYGWRHRHDPVFIQSFETWNLKKLRRMTRLRLVQLIKGSGAPYDLAAAGTRRTYRDLATPAGLRAIARYADGVSVATSRILPTGKGGRLRRPTALVRNAHRAGLFVHTWTVRPENAHLPAQYRRGGKRAHGDMAGWLRRLFRLGVDGVFTDHPGIAREARDRFLAGR